jgi:hypothetical protein
VRYELGFYIPEDGILHSHRRETVKSYIISQKVSIVVNGFLLPARLPENLQEAEIANLPAHCVLRP